MLLEVLYPTGCILCGEVFENSIFRKDMGEKRKEKLCRQCKRKHKPIREPICMKCGKKVELNTQEYCTDCAENEFSFERNKSVFEYRDEVQVAMYELKYNHQREVGVYFGEEILRMHGEWIRSLNVEAIVPIPIHKRRKIRRGYNQAEVIASVLGKELDIPVDNEVLSRKEDTKAQKELGRKERKINMKSALKISKNEVQYDRVLLVDDIYTTGTTLEAAAQVLKEHGVHTVYCVTACIGKGY